MTDSNVPTTIEYQESFADQVQDAKRSKFKTPRAGWMRLVFNKGEKKRTTKSGNLELTKRLSPVDADGNRVMGGTTSIRIYPPVQNTAHPGHKVPNTTFGCYCLARAIGADIPSFPRTDGNGGFLAPDGEPIDKETYGNLKRQTNVAVGKLAVDWYNEPGNLDDEVIYGLIEHEVKGDKVYTDVKRTRGEPPEGEEIITENFFVEDLEG